MLIEAQEGGPVRLYQCSKETTGQIPFWSVYIPSAVHKAAIDFLKKIKQV
jgi:hypothetical protein